MTNTYQLVVCHKVKHTQKRENHIKSFRKSCAIERSRHNVFVWHMAKLTMKLFFP